MPKSVKSHTPRLYSQAVDNDPRRHPIQPASAVLPPGVFETVTELYDYTVCGFDVDGRALSAERSVSEARWIIFDNVYSRRRDGDVFPAQAEFEIAIGLGFRPKGNNGTPKVTSPEFAQKLWKASVAQWGPPSDER